MKKSLLKYSFLIVFILLKTTFIFSQNKIHGQVKDKLSGMPLSFANIKYNENKTISDHNGLFSFTINNETLHLEISYVGYKNKKIDIEIKNNNFVDVGIIYLDEDFNSLNDVTITSGKYRKVISDVTVSIETLKPSFIEKNNTNSIDEILEKIPGVNYVDGQVNIRGGSGFSYGAGSRVQVLIDNLPALQFDSGYPNWENIPIETISKLEILKGAGSALYGSAAMNGVINILPIYAKDKLKIKLKVFHTIYDSAADPEKKWWDSSPFKTGVSGLLAKKFGKLDIVSSFYYQKFKSFRQFWFNNYDRLNLNFKYHINDNLKIGINTSFNSGKKFTFFYWKDSKEGAYKADSSAYAGQDKQVSIIDPFLTYYAKNGDKHNLRSRIYSVSNTVSGDKSNESISYYGEYQYQKIISKYNLNITGGITGTLSNTTAELYGDTSYVAKNYGIYLQAEKKFFDRLNIVLGSRYESNTISGPKIIQGKNISDKYLTESKPVFRFGANYKLFPHTNIRTSWGQGFRYPTIAEKFTNTFSGAFLILPNPDLKSESGHTIELGIRQGFKLSSFKGYIDISAFQSKYDDMIEFIVKNKKGVFFFVADNIGNTVIKGFEISSGFKGKIKNIDLNFMGGYLSIDPKYQIFTDDVKGSSSVDYNILKYRYKKSFKFDFELGYKQLTIGFGSSYNSFMEAIDKIFELNLKGLPKGVKDYRIKNNKGNNIYRARLGYKYKNIGVLFNIDNLFNKEYSVRPGLLEAPRSFTFSLTYSLN